MLMIAVHKNTRQTRRLNSEDAVERFFDNRDPSEWTICNLH